MCKKNENADDMFKEHWKEVEEKLLKDVHDDDELYLVNVLLLLQETASIEEGDRGKDRFVDLN